MEAHRRIKIKSMPKVLIIHLKRFKYNEELGSLQKLNYKVTYPEELNIDCIMADYVDKNYKSRSKSIITRTYNHSSSSAQNSHLNKSGMNLGAGDASSLFTDTNTQKLKSEKPKNQIPQGLSQAPTSANFNLTSAVIHCGEGLHRGHYVAIVKTAEPKYLLLDDEATKSNYSIDEFFGVSKSNSLTQNPRHTLQNNYTSNHLNLNERNNDSSSNLSSNNDVETAYILIYQRKE